METQLESIHTEKDRGKRLGGNLKEGESDNKDIPNSLMMDYYHN